MRLLSVTFSKAKQEHRKKSSDNDLVSDRMFMYTHMHLYSIWTDLYIRKH